MATVLGIDCSASGSNIGIGNCVAAPGQKIGHIKLPADWSAPITDTFNKAYWNNLVQQGVAQFFSGAFGVVTETADPTTETSSLQIQAVTTRALPVVTSIFKKGYEWHAGAFQNSTNGAQVIEIFQDGSMRVALAKDGLTISGFAVGMYEVLTLQDATADATMQSRIMYQMVDLLQYNTQGIFLTNLDFNPNTEINNIVDIAMTGRAIAGDKVYVKTPWLRNPSDSISGFAAANFRLFINGVQDAIDGTVTLNSTTKEWAITPTTDLAEDDVVVVELYDASATPEVAVAKVGTNNPKFYAGETSDIIVVENTSLPVITTDSFDYNSDGTTPNSLQLVATNSPTSYAVVSGTMPTGLTLNTTTGLITGTTNVGGGSNVTFSATNGFGTGANKLVHFGSI
jgi:putative Ig domain-containing protein